MESVMEAKDKDNISVREEGATCPTKGEIFINDYRNGKYL